MQGVIYKLTNKVNGMMYIGQTMDLKKRITRHLYASKSTEHTNGKYPISLAIAEFGINSFECEVLWKSEESSDKKAIREELNKKEVFYIKEYDSVRKGYNQTYGGGGLLGYRLSPESIEKVRQGNLGKKLPQWLKEENIRRFEKFRNDPEFKKRCSERMSGKNNPMFGVHLCGEKSYMFGRHLSEETKKKISEAKRGKRGKPMSEEHKEKLKKALIGVRKTDEHRIKLREASLGQKHPERQKPILQYDMDGNFVKEWSCAFEASSVFKDCHIGDCCRGTRNFSSGFQWRFKTENYPTKIPKCKRHSCKSIRLLDKYGNTIRVFDSIQEAVEILKINRDSIQRVLKGLQKKAKGHFFGYCET